MSVKKRERTEDADRKTVEEVRAKKEKADKAVIEKIAIAEQTLELVESFIRKLDADLGSFEVLLRGGGEFESMGAEPGQEVSMHSSVRLQGSKSVNYILHPRSLCARMHLSKSGFWGGI